jgi:hypothetical protein
MLDRSLTPIDTVYGKYRFRSRTEARWGPYFSNICNWLTPTSNRVSIWTMD